MQRLSDLKKEKLTGKDKKMMELIETVDSGRYCIGVHEVMLLADIYDNNMIDASYDLFRYGFLKGQRAMKAELKRKGIM
ncbi:hypothetical protein ACGCUP_00820 [Eubacteriales bacterium KG125]